MWFYSSRVAISDDEAENIVGGMLHWNYDDKEVNIVGSGSVYDMGILISIRTNGFAIDNEKIEWLKAKSPVGLQITFYGASDDTYEKVCGVKNGFTTVSQNVDKLIAAGLSVELSYTIINDNKDDFETARLWALDRKIKMFGYADLLNPNPNTERSVDGMMVDMGELPLVVPEDAVVPVKEKRFIFDKPFNNCRNYGCQFTLKWNGMLNICITMRSGDADVRKMSFADAYRLIYEHADKLTHPEKCRDCKYNEFCDACPSRLEADTGKPYEISEHYCRKAKMVFGARWCEMQIKNEEENKNNENKE